MRRSSTSRSRAGSAPASSSTADSSAGSAARPARSATRLSTSTDQACRCGSRGCLETVAGARAIVELLKPSFGGDLSLDGVLDRAELGDPACCRAIAAAGFRLGDCVANVCNLLNPGLIVVGGTLAGAGNILLDPMRTAVARRAIPSAGEDVEIVLGVLGDRAELLGAVALVLHESERTPPAPPENHERPDTAPRAATRAHRSAKNFAPTTKLVPTKKRRVTSHEEPTDPGSHRRDGTRSGRTHCRGLRRKRWRRRRPDGRAAPPGESDRSLRDTRQA